MNVFPELVLNYNPGADRHEYMLEGGLTKRELFAAMAMQGAISRAESDQPNKIAEYAVQYADALLATLEATP